MNLRLSSGFCHGMQLKSPDRGTRPTAGKVRSAVWNSLQSLLPGSAILDAFAGSGAVGIEALSRGAMSASFIEAAPAAVKALKDNLDEVQRRASKQGLNVSMRVLASPMLPALKQCAAASFDILWLDPPYKDLGQHWPSLAEELCRVAKADALLIVESDDEGAQLLTQDVAFWELDRQKSYGKVAVSFFKMKG